MKPTRIDTLPGKPKKGLDYKLSNGKHARVVYKVLSNDGTTMRVRVQAWEVNAQGQLQASPDGDGSRTASHEVEVHLSAIRGPLPTSTLKAGWVYSPAPVGELWDAQNPPTTTASGKGPPTKPGNEGDTYWDSVGLLRWAWHPGAVEGVLVDKASELETILDNSAALTDLNL